MSLWSRLQEDVDTTEVKEIVKRIEYTFWR